MIRTRIYALGVVVTFLVPSVVTAKALEDMYARTRLVQEKPRFERRLHELYAKGIWSSLAPQAQRALASVVIDMPLVGRDPETLQALGPMAFYSGVHGGRPFVAMPVLSLLFLEDLCTAYAWLYTHDYSLETVDEYVTMLRYKRAADFAGGHYPSPLQALQIPSDALADKRVDDLSLRLRNSAFAFILLHELGHIVHGHRGYKGVPMAQARSNEEDADRFALDVLHKTETIPMGAVLFFQAQAYFIPSKGQRKAEGRLQSDQDWDEYLNTEATHPLTAERLRKIALRLDKAADDASSNPYGKTLRYMATRLSSIGAILDLEDLQGCMAVVAHRAHPSTLMPRQPRAMTSTLLEKWCAKGKTP